MIAKEKFSPTKVSTKKSLIIILIIIIIYVIENSPIVNLINSMTFNYLIKPLLWLGLFLIICLLPKIRSKSELRHKKLLNIWAFNFAIIYIIISNIAGLIDGIGKSPYSHEPTGIVLNIFFVGSMIIGREYARSYLVNNLADKKEKYSIFILIALLMTFTKLSFSKIIELDISAGTLQYIAQFFGPEFCHSFLSTYLVFLGGPITSIIYYAIIEGYHWFSPILPNLKWITTALVGMLIPVFCLIIIQNLYLVTTKQLRRSERNAGGTVSWIITSTISIGIIWFVVGVFPIYPSVVATGSMEPRIKPGDVILVKKIYEVEEVKVEDVILFQQDDIRISHRVIEIVENKEGKKFRTKGDNNSAVDRALVDPEQLKGIVVKVVPKVGWPTLLLKSNKDINLDEIQY